MHTLRSTVLFLALLVAAISLHAADVAELIKSFPAQTAADRDTLCAELFKEGAPGIQALCRMLVEPGKGDDTKARFALQGMGIHASRPNADADRKLFAQTVAAELRGNAGPQAKAFLLTQLRLTAGDEQVADIAKLLSDTELSDHAAQTLLTIRTPSVAPALRAALASAKGPAHVTVITAIGNLRDKGAVIELLKDAESADSAIKNSALHALANIGDPASAPALAKAASVEALSERSQATQATLLLAQRLAEAGKNDDAAKICRDLMKMAPVEGEKNNHIQCAALNILSTALVEGAFDDLKAALKNESADVRAASLKIAGAVPGETVTRRWCAELKGADPKYAAEILAVLQRRGDVAGYPAVAEEIKSTDKTIRSAALAAAVIGGKDAFSALASALDHEATKENAEELAVTKLALARLKGEAINGLIVDALKGASLNLRKALIAALADRGAVEHIGILADATTDADPGIRAIAFESVGFLGDTKVLPVLLEVIVKTDKDEDRGSAEKAAAAIATRIENKAVAIPMITATLATAPVKAKQSLLRVLGKIAGPEALVALKLSLKDAAPEVVDTAVRELANWPDASAIDDVFDIAKNDQELTHHVLALTGFVRLVELAGKKGTNELLPRYKAALDICRRPDEKKKVLSGIQNVKTTDAAKMVEALMTDDALREEAVNAEMNIAKELVKWNKNSGRDAFQKIIETTKRENIKKEAQAELDKVPNK